MAHSIFGLSGGIGSGKSWVALQLEQRGARIIDTDQIARGLTQPNGLAIPLITQQFGTAVLLDNGALNRPALRQHIYGTLPEQQQAKTQLEAILHPLILQQVREYVAQSTAAPYTIIAVPLLFEHIEQWRWLDATIVIDCDEAIQVQRAMQRDLASEAHIQAIMRHQITRAERLKQANIVFLNQGPEEQLLLQIQTLHHKLCSF